MPKGKPHLYKEGGLIESLRAKHDPHYKLASKVAGLQDSGEQVDKLGKEIGIKFQFEVFTRTCDIIFLIVTSQFNKLLC